ncbi:MAG TPA: peptidoglycan DD-metalloendopeptidase family protein [Gemmatimonadales bacterium]
MRRGWLALLLLVLPAPVLAQNTAQELQESRRRLEEIRIERERLARQQQRLQGQAHDVADELDNLERQRQSTSRIVDEIERQITGLVSQVDRSTAELVLAQDNLAERRAVLERRLVDIYKRGPLYTFQVLLAAESFGDLLSRYKYLYLTSRQDRALVADVERLASRVSQQRQEIVRVKEQLDNTRTEREEELDRYGQLAQQRSRRLATLQRSARETERRLAQLERDAARLTDVLASLERARVEEEARARRAAASAGTPVAAPARGSITTASLGRLEWPVEGRIVFPFGRQTLPSGGVVRNNGIGIGAAAGTPVKAVESGTVALVERLSTYGLSVIVAHGDGYYSLYMQLRSAAVERGATITRGQVIGTVGGENSDFGPHLQFQIRGDNEVALDPTEWLRRR